MINVNPGSGVKDVVGVFINPGSGVKTCNAVWQNIGGTLYQVWPDYAFDGTKFFGVLKNGMVSCPYALRHYDGNGRNNTRFNDASSFGQAITTGPLYVSDFNQYESGSIITPAICVSADVVDFSKYSKLRLTGHWYATSSGSTYPQPSVSAAVAYRPAITIYSMVYTDTTYTNYGSVESGYGQLGVWELYGTANGNSGTKTFDVTLDISGLTRSNTKMEIMVGANGFEYYEKTTTTTCNFYITGIKFER